MMGELNRPGAPILPYPLQRLLMRNVAIPAEQSGRPDLMQLWAGQSAALVNNPDAADFLRSLIDDVNASLRGAP